MLLALALALVHTSNIMIYKNCQQTHVRSWRVYGGGDENVENLTLADNLKVQLTNQLSY